MQNFVDTLRYYADMALHVQRRSPLAVAGHEAWTVRQPWGPCGFIFPWNFPMLLMGWNLSPALAAGNTVVVKPAEDTPLSAIYLARLAREVGIPDGVINVVPGFGDPAGAALASHPGLKRMSFTGSPEVGRLIAAACGRNLVPVKLELGGKGAAVVFDDVDLPQTVEQLAQAITFHAGQVCCDATRWLVHRSIYKQFVAASVARLRQVQVGYQFDAGHAVGPGGEPEAAAARAGLSAARARGRGRACYWKAGRRKCPAETDFTSSRPCWPARSTTWPPARRSSAPWPTCAVRRRGGGHPAGQPDRLRPGQQCWTSDLARAHRVAEAMVAGNSWINAHNLFPQGVPYAGVNKSGMGGGVLSVETLLDYWRSLSVVRPL